MKCLDPDQSRKRARAGARIKKDGTMKVIGGVMLEGSPPAPLFRIEKSEQNQSKEAASTRNPRVREQMQQSDWAQGLYELHR